MVIIDSFYHFQVFYFYLKTAVRRCDTTLKSVLHKCGLHVSLNIKFLFWPSLSGAYNSEGCVTLYFHFVFGKYIQCRDFCQMLIFI